MSFFVRPARGRCRSSQRYRPAFIHSCLQDSEKDEKETEGPGCDREEAEAEASEVPAGSSSEEEEEGAEEEKPKVFDGIVEPVTLHEPFLPVLAAPETTNPADSSNPSPDSLTKALLATASASRRQKDMEAAVASDDERDEASKAVHQAGHLQTQGCLMGMLDVRSARLARLILPILHVWY